MHLWHGSWTAKEAKKTGINIKSVSKIHCLRVIRHTNVRKEASTSTTSLYNTGSSSNYAFLILGESGSFYKVQSDPVLNSGRTQIDKNTGKYNASAMYAYSSKDYIKVVNSGSSGSNNSSSGSNNNSSGNNSSSTTKGIVYSTHVQTYGWQSNKSNGQTAGTSREAKRMEAIKIQLSNTGYTGSVQYSTHVQTYGWKDWVADGAIGGTTGEAKRMEAIRIRLTGEVANHYDIYYRVHTQTYGWLDWAKNGDIAGTTDGAKRMEAIQIVLVTKGGSHREQQHRHMCSRLRSIILMSRLMAGREMYMAVDMAERSEKPSEWKHSV